MNNDKFFKKIKIFIIIACVIYILSPYDFIPDYSIIGHLDDLLIFFLITVVVYSLYLQIKEEKESLLRKYFLKEYPEVEKKYNDLLECIGKEEKYLFYKNEALKVFEELLKVYSNILESNLRIKKLIGLKEKLLETLNNNEDSARVKEGMEKSKDLINRIEIEISELEKYISDARGEIEAAGLDFIHVAAEIELSRGTGQLFEPIKLSSRSKSLSFIASNLPSITEKEYL